LDPEATRRPCEACADERDDALPPDALMTPEERIAYGPVPVGGWEVETRDGRVAFLCGPHAAYEAARPTPARVADARVVSRADVTPPPRDSKRCGVPAECWPQCRCADGARHAAWYDCPCGRCYARRVFRGLQPPEPKATQPGTLASPPDRCAACNGHRCSECYQGRADLGRPRCDCPCDGRNGPEPVRPTSSNRRATREDVRATLRTLETGR
jgi:hypothetical protein